MKLPVIQYPEGKQLEAGRPAVQVGALQEAPVTKRIDLSGRGDDEWVRWSLECQVADAPVGGVVGDPTATWQALKDSGKTWGDLLAAGTTWLDLLKGEW